MESEAVRRRMNMLAAHFAPNEIDKSPTHLLPMNCSSTLNSIMARRDNKICFGRQSSASQGYFMRQASITDNQKQDAEAEPFFARPMTTKIESNLSNTSAESIESCVKDTKKVESKSDVPCFARAIARKKQQHPSESDAPNVAEWSPRMDVAESGRSYILTVEIPGVNVNDIRVELNHHKLRIMGKRSRQYWRTNDSISGYHKREILQGPYLVEWPLPSDANKDKVSAEFLDGILQIIIPKL